MDLGCAGSTVAHRPARCVGREDPAQGGQHYAHDECRAPRGLSSHHAGSPLLPWESLLKSSMLGRALCTLSPVPCVDPVRVSGREAVYVRQASPRPCLNLNPSSRHRPPSPVPRSHDTPVRPSHRASPDTRQSEIANAIRPNPLRYQRYQRNHSPKIRAAVCTFCVRHTAKVCTRQTAPAVDGP